jgi:DmsE family decaheme c-type cytochrome
MNDPNRFIRLAILLVLAAAVSAWAADTGDSAACAACHDELAAKLAQTSHGLTLRGAPSCQACHGEGKEHMESGDTSKISKPSGTAGEALCRACHAQVQGRTLPSGAAHPAASVGCFSCHSIHKGDPAKPSLLTRDPNQLCESCHAAQAAEFRRPYGHRLQGGSVQCVSCHDPHAGTGEKSLRLDHGGQGPCTTCHAEKRGPFVFAHVGGATGDCLSCHEPHGSTNPMGLKRPSVEQLCLECHSPIAGATLGSQPPSIHDLRSPRYRNCTVCHVAVHGSNTSTTLLK